MLDEWSGTRELSVDVLADIAQAISHDLGLWVLCLLGAAAGVMIVVKVARTILG